MGDRPAVEVFWVFIIDFLGHFGCTGMMSVLLGGFINWPGSGHILIFFLKLIDDARDALGFIDQTILLLAKGVDDFIMGLGGFAERSVLGRDKLIPLGAKGFDFLLVHLHIRKNAIRRSAG